MTSLPLFIAPAQFDDADAALEQVRTIYTRSVQHLRQALQAYVRGAQPQQRCRAYYPFVRRHTATAARADSRRAYGFVAGPGTYETTLTRPDLFARYYRRQFELLLRNHQVRLEVGTSNQPNRRPHGTFELNDCRRGGIAHIHCFAVNDDGQW